MPASGFIVAMTATHKTTGGPRRLTQPRRWPELHERLKKPNPPARNAPGPMKASKQAGQARPRSEPSRQIGQSARLNSGQAVDGLPSLEQRMHCRWPGS